MKVRSSKTFKLSLNLSLTHFRAQIASCEFKEDLSPLYPGLA